MGHGNCLLPVFMSKFGVLTPNRYCFSSKSKKLFAFRCLFPAGQILWRHYFVWLIRFRVQTDRHHDTGSQIERGTFKGQSDQDYSNLKIGASRRVLTALVKESRSVRKNALTFGARLHFYDIIAWQQLGLLAGTGSILIIISMPLD